jgi:hypothetical protein
MRRILLTATLFLTACAAAPEPVAETPAPVAQAPRAAGVLIGLTATELVQRFGTPALTVREGSGLKLQFRATACVLDAYLYPAPAGPERVSYVNARLRSGVDTDQASCIAAFGAP